MQLYYLALVVPEPFAARIVQTQHELERRFGYGKARTSPPHVTLVPPFPFEEELLPELGKVLDRITQAFRPFTVLVQGTDSFPSHTVFLHILQNRSLRVLEHKLWQGVTGAFPSVAWKDRVRFHPHITLATGIRREEDFFAMKKLAAEAGGHAQFTVGYVTLLNWKHDQWIPVSKYLLQGGKKCGVDPAP